MPAVRTSFLTAFLLLVLLVLLAACRSEESADTQPAKPVAPAEPAPAISRFAATGWPEDAGPVVVLPGGNTGIVRLVLPELTDKSLSDTSSFELDSLPDAAISLFSQNRKPLSAVIAGGGTEETLRGCKSWPTARLQSDPGTGWRIGLATGTAAEIPLQDWGPGLKTDSTIAAAEVIALASKGRADSVFGGIPFAVRFLHRIELGNSRAIVADAVRRINTEANVREEHVLIVAESANKSSRYSPAYRESQAGREDEVRVPEIAAAVLLGENRRPALFVTLEYSEGARLLLIERMAAFRWVLRWRSAYSGC